MNLTVPISSPNPPLPELQGLEVSALAISGAVPLCIPEHIAIQLQLRELEQRKAILAEGRRLTVPYMGSIEVRFANRRCFTEAMLLGNEVRLGVIPKEDRDLRLWSQLLSITVNPFGVGSNRWMFRKPCDDPEASECVDF